MVGLRVALLVAAGAIALAAAPPERAASAPRYVEASADTIRQSVIAGETLIVALPGPDYRALNPPALSWLVDRSFMWRTLPQERGALAVRFARGNDDEVAVVLLVEIVG